MHAAAKEDAPSGSTEASSLYKKQDLSLKEGETIKCAARSQIVSLEWSGLNCPDDNCELCRRFAVCLCVPRINMRRTSGDRPAASSGGFFSNLPVPPSSSQAGEPISLKPLAPPAPKAPLQQVLLAA